MKPNTTADAFRKYFATFGKVIEAHVPAGKLFGFVTFDAKTAEDVFRKPHFLEGSRLFVERATGATNKRATTTEQQRTRERQQKLQQQQQQQQDLLQEQQQQQQKQWQREMENLLDCVAIESWDLRVDFYLGDCKGRV